MRRIAIGVAATISSLILLFSYRTSTMGTLDASSADPGAGAGSGSAGVGGATGGSSATTATTGAGRSAAGRTTTTTGSGSASASASGGAGTTTYDGSVVRTRYGNVQVRITVQDGRITDVTTLQVPNGSGRDRAINNQAVPMLRQQVLTAQSADIAGVSGATYTSDGYIQSLESALAARG